MSWAPYEHPSGEYFLFASNKLGFENFEVFMVDKAGPKEPVRVTYSDGFDGLPVPSPDGKQLAWTSSALGRRRWADLPGAVEPRGRAEGARGGTAAQVSSQVTVQRARFKAMQQHDSPDRGLVTSSSASRRARTAQTAAAVQSPTRAHVETPRVAWARRAAWRARRARRRRPTTW